MEVLNQIWQVIAPYVTGVSIGGILSAILYGVLKGAFSRTISKLNVEKIAEDATTKVVGQMKEVSFKQSIQPLVESELAKITEKANSYIEAQLEEMQKRYDHLVEVMEKLAAYFDNSIGVSDKAKAELKQALADAKIEPMAAESVIAEQVIEVTVEKPVSAAKVKPTRTKSER